MIAPGRTSALSPFVHAVDAGGSLCGATPSSSRRWLFSTVLPITCPRCLLRMGRERWATCGVPGPKATSKRHARRVGAEGMSFTGNPAGARTLCEKIAGWDSEELDAAARREFGRREADCPACARLLNHPALGRSREASPR